MSKCKSVKEKELSIKDLDKIRKQFIENPINFQQALISLQKTSSYSYEMLIALQQQIICLEAKIKILEEVYKKR